MRQFADLDEISRDILKELGNIGTGNAVTALSQMLMHPVASMTTRLITSGQEQILLKAKPVCHPIKKIIHISDSSDVS